MATKKGGTINIVLKSTKSGYFYVIKKNTRNTTGKMSFNKYDPFVRQHVAFMEEKLVYKAN